MLNLIFASLYKKLFLSTIFRRIQLIVSEYELPLNVTERLQNHKGERVWEPLLHHSKYHTVTVVLVILKILVQLLNNVKTLDHQFFALLLSLGEEIGAEDDFWVVDGEHLKLILCLIDCMFDLHFVDADVVFEISKLFFLVN